MVQRRTCRRGSASTIPTGELADPSGYLVWLRDLLGPDAWIVIEKILAVDEALEPTLPVAGTTGYDVLREVGGVFVDPDRGHQR